MCTLLKGTASARASIRGARGDTTGHDVKELPPGSDSAARSDGDQDREVVRPFDLLKR